jgi:hypothetical protein
VRSKPTIAFDAPTRDTQLRADPARQDDTPGLGIALKNFKFKLKYEHFIGIYGHNPNAYRSAAMQTIPTKKKAAAKAAAAPSS